MNGDESNREVSDPCYKDYRANSSNLTTEDFEYKVLNTLLTINFGIWVLLTTLLAEDDCCYKSDGLF